MTVANHNEYGQPANGTPSSLSREKLSARLLSRLLTELIIPADDAIQSRACGLCSRFWRKEGEAFLRLKNSVRAIKQLLSDTSSCLGRVGFAGGVCSHSLERHPLARFDNDASFRLSAAAIARSGRQGGADTATRRLSPGAADADGADDYAQFLHFVHEESGAQWRLFDQQPLGSATCLPGLWYEWHWQTAETWEIAAAGRSWRPGGINGISPGCIVKSEQRAAATRPERNDAQGNPFLDARVPLGRPYRRELNRLG